MVEVHGMRWWVAGGHRYTEPGQPEVACVIDGVVRAQSDCEVCVRELRGSD